MTVHYKQQFNFKNISPMVNSNKNCSINYFFPGLSREADRKKSAKIMKLMHNKFLDFFSGIDCFEGTFSLQLKEGSKSCQALLRYVAV